MDSSFWQYKVYADKRVVKRHWGSMNSAIISVLSVSTYSEALEVRLTLQYYLTPHWLSTDPMRNDLKWSRVANVSFVMIILHILWINSIVFIVSRTLLSLCCQVKLTWFSGRRLLPQWPANLSHFASKYVGDFPRSVRKIVTKIVNARIPLEAPNGLIISQFGLRAYFTRN